MKLVCFEWRGRQRVGVVIDGSVHDVSEVLGDGPTLTDVGGLLDHGGEILDRLRGRIGDGELPGAVPLRDVTLHPPVLRPPSIRDHIAFEEHATRQFTRPIVDVWRRRPIHYYSNPSRLLGHGAIIPTPATERLDLELEIAAVIGKECSDVDEAEAMACVAGFTIMNDWSARDLQADEMGYGLGPCKGKDFATSLGPWVVTCDELAPYMRAGVLDLACTVRVNGAVWARSNARLQYHSWAAMIVHASQDSRLLTGDVLAGGTVSGCSIGEAIRKGYDARYLVEGDIVELEVDQLGTLTNTIGPPSRSRSPKYRAPELPPYPKVLPRGSPYRVGPDCGRE
jgi:fumarylacetoacetate (FAA) hydrolase